MNESFKYKCPLCDKPLMVMEDETGVMVKCYNIPCDSQCHENVFGHGRNEKDAWETACQKYIKPLKN